MMLTNETVDYLGKRNGIGLQKRLVKKSPGNGALFISGESEPEIIVAGRKPRFFADLKNAVVAANYEKQDLTDASFPGSLGVMAMCNRQSIETNSGTQLSKCDAWNVLKGIKATEHYSQELLASQFSQVYGTSSSEIAGSTLTASSGNNPRLCIPLALCGFTSEQLVPLDCSEDLRIKINYESALTAMFGDTTLASSSVIITNVQLIYDEYEMSPEEYARFKSSLPGGVYKINNTDFYHQSEIIPLASTGTIINIGLNKRLCKRLIFCLRTNSKLNTIAALGLTSRNKAGITGYKIEYGGSIVGLTEINSNNECESLLEVMKSNGGILDTNPFNLTLDNNNFNLAQGAANANDTCGKCFFVFDFTSGFDNEHTMTGLDITAGNLTLTLTKAASTADQIIDIWVEYYSEMTLIPGGQWSVSS